MLDRARWQSRLAARDHASLQFGISNVLADHHIDLHLVKISPPGERVGDPFLISDPDLGNSKARDRLESGLQTPVAN